MSTLYDKEWESPCTAMGNPKYHSNQTVKYKVHNGTMFAKILVKFHQNPLYGVCGVGDTRWVPLLNRMGVHVLLYET